jgi:type I restriction enzyme M protein
VLARQAQLQKKKLENMDDNLRAVPGFAFYNTGIATYVWVVTNCKTSKRRGTVQLIDATGFWVPMRKSLGDKRREIPNERAQDLLRILSDFKDGDERNVGMNGSAEMVVVSKVFPTTQ